jgi:hypothetical protein
MIQQGRAPHHRGGVPDDVEPSNPKIMKTLHAIILGLLLAGGAVANDKLDEADKKWSAAVEKMIKAGPTTISTPSEKRMELAKQLAEKSGRKTEVSKTGDVYRITVK